MANPSEMPHRKLRRGIDGPPKIALISGDRRDIDNMSRTLTTELRKAARVTERQTEALVR